MFKIKTKQRWGFFFSFLKGLGTPSSDLVYSWFSLGSNLVQTLFYEQVCHKYN